MTDTQFAALSALLIDLNGFLERTADSLERHEDIFEEICRKLPERSEPPIRYTDPPKTQNTPGLAHSAPGEVDISFPEAPNAPGDVLVDPWPKRKAPADPWT